MGVRSLIWAVGLSVVGAWGVATETFAQNSPVEDSTLGIESSIVSPSDLVDARDIITGGAIRGNNLFHSFSEFSIGENRSVYFSSPTSEIQSIFSRVTGTERSEILGTLGTFGSSAPDLWLINPNGIIFGENAILDVGASFVATTADSLRFGAEEFEEFSAVNPESPASTLTIAPSAYLFTQGVPAAIESQSVVDGFLGDGFPGLRVRSGENLTFLGGDIVIDGGNITNRAGLHAFGGRIQLGALGVPGEILTDSEGNIVFAEGTTRGDVELKNRARIEVSLDGGGDVNIFGRDITISGNSRVDAGISEGLGTNNSQAGDVALDATQILRVFGQSEIDNGVDENAIGNGGTIKITSNILEVRDGGRLSSSISDSSAGDAGDIEINVVGQVTFNDGNIFSNANSETRGNRNSVTINVGSLRALNNSEFQALTRGGSDAGNIVITARDKVQFDNSNIFTSAQPGATGAGGDIQIRANSLELVNTSQLSSSTSGSSNAGNVTLDVRDFTVFDNSRIFTSVQSGATGAGGNIQVTAGSSDFLNSSSLVASTSGGGNAGNVTLDIRDFTVFDNSNIFGDVKSGATGTGGNVQIITNSLTLKNNALLSTDTEGDTLRSDAGDIEIIAGSITMMGDSRLLTGTLGEGDAGNVTLDIRDSAVFNNSNIFTSVRPRATGAGGNVKITAGSSELLNSSSLVASTSGIGNAGNVTLDIRDSAVFNNSRIFSNVLAEAQGSGGDIQITAGSSELINGSSLEASTSGSGSAGDVVLKAPEGRVLLASENSDNGAYSTIFTNSRFSSVGSGGNISLEASSLVIKGRAGLVASSGNDQQGGNINLSLGKLEMLDGGQIITSSDDSGPAGTIFLDATEGIRLAGRDLTRENENTLFTPESTLSVVSRKEGIAGNVVIGRLRDTSNIVLEDGGRITAESATVDGGSIFITLNEFLLLRNGSLISATAGNEQSGGDGGNIRLDIPFIVAIPDENGDITANAFTGSGGNVDITSRGLFGIEARPAVTPLSDITASSERGVSGVVSIDAPDTGAIENSLNDLPDSIISPDQILIASCISRTNQNQGTFNITGSGGLPSSPNSDILSTYPTSQIQSPAATQWQLGDPINEATGIYELADGRLSLSQDCNNRP
ncbi:filamentous hemagglutinin N-terminal domain-containing protein [Adonisia turfae]|uniref:Filamentous hemagglutinin N-terminal domain-containing protein n=1 Tax=Adonisia turfae CCMR0081 TaxID=2292702 RepID=A0A6M0RRM9_9CYAN|nr:filamentous hemagglutinin N-terminal domain-containing protein [Adonisia turfae]NEZ58453.1 filamentous hemagglutinin N-terminal domain-containing protein [Adonisia turfae CCMR0081]